MPEKIVLEQDKNIKTKEVERPVDTPADFTSPEVLYQDLITEIKNIIRHRIYLILRKHIRSLTRHMKDRRESRVSHI